MYSDATIQQAVKIFQKAAKYIRKYGWQEKGMGEYGQSRCSMGALASAHQTKMWDKNLAGLMYRQLYRQLDGFSLTEFNSTYKNGEAVAKLFERTATSLITGKV